LGIVNLIWSAKRLENDAMKKILVFAAVAEAATGLALLIVPSLVGQLLLGEEFTGVAITVARVAGIALIALGVACWPGTPLVGMLTYSAAVTLYLAYIGFTGGGLLLWPAVVLHVILTALLLGHQRATRRRKLRREEADGGCAR
jgi:hypothetical protein